MPKTSVLDYEAIKDNKKKSLSGKNRLINENPFSFFSKGDINSNFNRKFFAKDGNPIACRHFAAAQLYYGNNIEQVTYHEAFKNPQTIPFLYENTYDRKKLTSKAQCYYLFDINRIGLVLCELSQCMGINTQKKMLFHSENHTMNIKIKKKGSQGFIVQFYDPNKTLVHKNIWYPDSGSIAALTIDDLLDKEYKKHYFPKFNGFLAIEPQDDTEEQEFLIEGTISVIDKLYFGLLLGHTVWVQNATNSILSLAVNEEEKNNLLAAKTANGVPALSMAMQNGHHQAVEKYITAILSSNLENKETLLAATRADGVPALSMAMRNGHHQAVKKYITAILSSKNLTNTQKETLLAAKIADDVPALFMAMKNGHHQAVEKYITAILSSNLENKETLLAATRANGVPALSMAMRNGHHQVVEKYTTAILSSNLENKETLLAATRADGVLLFRYS